MGIRSRQNTNGDNGGHGRDDGASAVPPALLKRSLILSATGSILGSFFFSLIAGNVLNRYFEALGLKEKLGIFLALPSIAGMTQMLGSWIMQKTGRRKLFFFLFLGPPRLIWLAIVTIQLWGPPEERSRVVILSALVLTYWITAGLGGNAWFSWMRDIVPENYRGRYFAYRATLGTAVAAAWGLTVGHLLERMNLSLGSFELIYGIGVFFGLVDILCFIWVYHPVMEVKKGFDAGLVPMAKAAMHPVFLKYVGVMSVMWFSFSLEALTGYHMMRGIGMEIFSMQMLAFFSTVVFVVFSLLWGHFLDHYGYKATLVVGMLGMIPPPLLVMLAPYYGEVTLYLASAIGTIMAAGLNLASTNMLLGLSKKEDQAMTMAAYSVAAGMVMAVGYVVCENAMYPVLKWLGNKYEYGPLFYAVCIYGVIGCMRVAAGLMSFRMPEMEDKPTATLVARAFYMTNPIRAMYSMVRFLRVKSGDLVGSSRYSELHPSARWRLE